MDCPHLVNVNCVNCIGIANSAFQNCIRFEAVNLPKLTEIKSFALQNTALVNIELNFINNEI